MKITQWAMRNGRVVEISAMEGQHLRNTIAMLRRQIRERQREENAGWSCLSMLQGEYASYYAERDVMRAADENIEFTRWARPIIDAMETELARREA